MTTTDNAISEEFRAGQKVIYRHNIGNLRADWRNVPAVVIRVSAMRVRIRCQCAGEKFERELCVSPRSLRFSNEEIAR